MLTESELPAAVDAAFAVTGRGLAPWPDPHPERSPHEEEYSRLLDPAKWRICGARVDAWVAVLVDAGVATLVREPDVSWPRDERPERFTRVERLAPHAAGAVPLTIGRAAIEGVAEAGLTLGVGDPIVSVSLHPDCGCDACDSGSQDELERLDRIVHAVVTGTFRHLSDGPRTLTVLGEREWSSTADLGRRSVERILADPTGWHEVSGPSWLAAHPTPAAPSEVSG